MLEEIKEEEHIDSVTLQKSQEMTAIDSMTLKMKKKKRPSKQHHKHRLMKQKSNHSYATAGDIANLKTILSPVEDEEFDEEPPLMKKQSDEIALVKNRHTHQNSIKPMMVPKLNHNSSMSTPLIK